MSQKIGKTGFNSFNIGRSDAVDEHIRVCRGCNPGGWCVLR